MKRIFLEYFSFLLFGSFNGGNEKFILLFGSLSGRKWNQDCANLHQSRQDRPAPTFPHRHCHRPTESMPVIETRMEFQCWCSEDIKEGNLAPSESQTKLMNKYLFASATFGVVYPVSFLIFFTKTSSYWYYYKYKKEKKTHTHTKTAPFYARFSDIPQYKFISYES